MFYLPFNFFNNSIICLFCSLVFLIFTSIDKQVIAITITPTVIINSISYSPLRPITNKNQYPCFTKMLQLELKKATFSRIWCFNLIELTTGLFNFIISPFHCHLKGNIPMFKINKVTSYIFDKSLPRQRISTFLYLCYGL